MHLPQRPLLALALLLAALAPLGAAATDETPPPATEVVTPTASTTPTSGLSLPTADALENNYDGDHAALLAIGLPYELNFTCPDPLGGCVAGDHDHLRLPVKAGLHYLVATYDLAPGTDTVVELLGPDGATPLLGNDDLAPGLSFLSMLDWHAEHDGLALLRVGPAHHQGLPRTAASSTSTVGSYRLMAALADSTAGQELAALARAQSGLPEPVTPTAALTEDAEPAAEPGDFDAPPAVEPPLFEPPLFEPVPAAPLAEPTAVPDLTPLPEPTLASEPRRLPARAVSVLPEATAVAAQEPLVRGALITQPLHICRRTTAVPCKPLAGLLVQLNLALDGRPLAEATTDAGGSATLRAMPPAGQGLRLHVPALGIDVPYTPTNGPLPIVVAPLVAIEALL